MRLFCSFRLRLRPTHSRCALSLAISTRVNRLTIETAIRTRVPCYLPCPYAISVLLDCSTICRSSNSEQPRFGCEHETLADHLHLHSIIQLVPFTATVLYLPFGLSSTQQARDNAPASHPSDGCRTPATPAIVSAGQEAASRLAMGGSEPVHLHIL